MLLVTAIDGQKGTVKCVIDTSKITCIYDRPSKNAASIWFDSGAQENVVIDYSNSSFEELIAIIEADRKNNIITNELDLEKRPIRI